MTNRLENGLKVIHLPTKLGDAASLQSRRIPSSRQEAYESRSRVVHGRTILSIQVAVMGAARADLYIYSRHGFQSPAHVAIGQTLRWPIQATTNPSDWHSSGCSPTGQQRGRLSTFGPGWRDSRHSSLVNEKHNKQKKQTKQKKQKPECPQF